MTKVCAIFTYKNIDSCNFFVFVEMTIRHPTMRKLDTMHRIVCIILFHFIQLSYHIFYIYRTKGKTNVHIAIRHKHKYISILTQILNYRVNKSITDHIAYAMGLVFIQQTSVCGQMVFWHEQHKQSITWGHIACGPINDNTEYQPHLYGSKIQLYRFPVDIIRID